MNRNFNSLIEITRWERFQKFHSNINFIKDRISNIKKINSALESNPSDYNEIFFEKYQSKKNMLALSISKWGDLQKEHEKLNK